MPTALQKTIDFSHTGAIQDTFYALRNLYRHETCEIYVDGSYFDKKSNRAGTGAVIIDPNTNEVAFCMAFNISNLGIRASRHAELWAATLAMEAMTDMGVKVTKLTCDSPVTKHRIQNIREGDHHNTRFLNDTLAHPALFDRMRTVLEHQEDMHVHHVNRRTKHMPLADHFARKSAERRIGVIAQMPLDRGIPCAFYILNGEGDVRQFFFYDRIENYDMSHKTVEKSIQTPEISVV